MTNTDIRNYINSFFADENIYINIYKYKHPPVIKITICRDESRYEYFCSDALKDINNTISRIKLALPIKERQKIIDNNQDLITELLLGL